MLRFAKGAVEMIRQYKVEKAENWNQFEERLVRLIRHYPDDIYIIETKDKNGRNPIHIYEHYSEGREFQNRRFVLLEERLTQDDFNTIVRRVAKLDKGGFYEYLVPTGVTLPDSAFISDVWEVSSERLEETRHKVIGVIYCDHEKPAYFPDPIVIERGYPEAEQEHTAHVSLRSTIPLTDKQRAAIVELGYRHIGHLYLVGPITKR